jgi:hypothetical protein
VTGRPIENEARELADELQRTSGQCHDGLWGGGFVRIPNAFWDSGFFVRMRPAEISLLLAIFRLASYGHGRRVIHAPTSELCRTAGISPRAFWDAIRKLSEAQIIAARPVGKGYEILFQSPANWELTAFAARSVSCKNSSQIQTPTYKQTFIHQNIQAVPARNALEVKPL